MALPIPLTKLPNPSLRLTCSFPPNPSLIRQHFAPLHTYLATLTDLSVLRYALGIPLPNTPPSLLTHDILLNCTDAEWWELLPSARSPITEVGLTILDTNTLRSTNPGPYGKHFLQKLQFFHWRSKEYGHMWNSRHCHANPENFHFGVSVFGLKDQAVRMLEAYYDYTLIRGTGECEVRPVVNLGHAVHNDFRELKEKLGVDVEAMCTVVRTIDTQRMARECGIRDDGSCIGLRDLCARFIGNARDLHNGGNDAAYTFICAVQMALGHTELGGKGKRNLGKIADRLYTPRVPDMFVPIDAVFCTKCESREHTRPQCDEEIMCRRCLASDCPDEKDHLERRCICPSCYPMSYVVVREDWITSDDPATWAYYPDW